MFKKTIPRIIFIGYICIILIGTFLLYLPISQRAGISFIDSLFTSTSSVCVTGLIVKDTPKDFTLFGQIVILILIQIGGLGYMSIATMLFMLLGRNLSIKQASIAESTMAYPYGDIKLFIFQVIKFTIGFQIIGTIILTFNFLALGIGSASFFFALFHSISAFCNAGFSLFSDSIITYAHSSTILFTIAGLLIAGGLGFIVHRDIYRRFTGWKSCLPLGRVGNPVGEKKKFLTLHTKLVIITTGILIIVSTFVILALEWDGVLQGMTFITKLRSAFFQSVVPRTAGFTAVSIGEYKPATSFWTILLMFIGGAPGGTAGGIKITTAMVCLLSLLSFFRNQQNPVFLGKRIGNAIITKSLILVLLSILIITFFTIILLISESVGNPVVVGNPVGNKKFIALLFEMVSAFGTVGLSFGSKINPFCSLSYDFSNIGKFIIILTMVIGRIGTLTIGSLFIQPIKREVIRYPKEDVLVG